MIGRALEFAARLRRLAALPPSQAAWLVKDFVSRRIAERREQWRDRFSPTHAPDRDIPAGAMARVIPPLEAAALAPWKAAILEAAGQAR
ncbi:MAG: hypothetical protein OEX21_12115, partial [Betaproteobacteria bacterium]|nr:hypothetical protein [Betaproteobacteria bacterium]